MTNSLKEETCPKTFEIDTSYTPYLLKNNRKILNKDPFDISKLDLTTFLQNPKGALILPFLNPNSVNGQVAVYKYKDSDVEKMIKVQLRSDTDSIVFDYINSKLLWSMMSKSNSVLSNNVMQIEKLITVPICQIDDNQDKLGIDIVKYNVSNKFNVFPAVILPKHLILFHWKLY